MNFSFHLSKRDKIIFGIPIIAFILFLLSELIGAGQITSFFGGLLIILVITSLLTLWATKKIRFFQDREIIVYPALFLFTFLIFYILINFFIYIIIGVAIIFGILAALESDRRRDERRKWEKEHTVIVEHRRYEDRDR